MRGCVHGKVWDKLVARKFAQNGMCSVCGGGDYLSVHLVVDVCEPDISALRVMCWNCHDMAHTLRRDGHMKYKSNSSAESRFNTEKNRILWHRKNCNLPEVSGDTLSLGF